MVLCVYVCVAEITKVNEGVIKTGQERGRAQQKTMLKNVCMCVFWMNVGRNQRVLWFWGNANIGDKSPVDSLYYSSSLQFEYIIQQMIK